MSAPDPDLPVRNSAEPDPEGTPPPPPPGPTSAGARLLESIRNPSFPVLVAFSVVVAIVVIMLQTTPPAPDAVRILPGDPGEVAAALPGAPIPGAMSEAIAAYGAGDLERAADLLAATAADGLANEMRRAYLGSALLRRGRAEEATVVLEAGIDPALPEPWRTEAIWTRVIALRQSGRTDEATRALEELAAGEGPLGDRARRLLATEDE